MSSSDLKYLIIGTGGTGAAIGSSLLKAGKNVTFIARGSHLEALKNNGLKIEATDETIVYDPVRVSTMDDYNGEPDVIFVCVKGYSINDTIPFIRRIAGEETVVIPILNVYGTGGKMQEHLPGILVTDGCIYVAAHVKEPGCIALSGDILRVVFGVRKEEEYHPVLEQIRDDLARGGVDARLSDNIRRDAMKKYSYISAQNACGTYYDIPAGPMQEPGKYRDCFTGLIREIVQLSEAMGICFDEDLVALDLDVIDNLAPEMLTSMQRDLAAGKKTEMDGLVYEVVRLAEKCHISVPLYDEISTELKKRGY